MEKHNLFLSVCVCKKYILKHLRYINEKTYNNKGASKIMPFFKLKIHLLFVEARHSLHATEEIKISESNIFCNKTQSFLYSLLKVSIYCKNFDLYFRINSFAILFDEKTQSYCNNIFSMCIKP